MAPGLQHGAPAAARGAIERGLPASAAQAARPARGPLPAFARPPRIAARLTGGAALDRRVQAAPGAQAGLAAGVVAPLGRAARVAPPLLRVAELVGGLGLRVAGALGRPPLPGAGRTQPMFGFGRRLAAAYAQALGDALGGALPLARAFRLEVPVAGLAGGPALRVPDALGLAGCSSEIAKPENLQEFQ